jgi:hypothetical protein
MKYHSKLVKNREHFIDGGRPLILPLNFFIHNKGKDSPQQKHYKPQMF